MKLILKELNNRGYNELDIEWDEISIPLSPFDGFISNK
jgi:hypothetical protein